MQQLWRDIKHPKGQCMNSHKPDENTRLSGHHQATHVSTPHAKPDAKRNGNAQGSRNPITFYSIAIVLCVALGGGIAVYTSKGIRRPQPPARIADDAFNTTLASSVEPAQHPSPSSVPAPAPPRESVPTFQPDGTIDVPGVGLRKSPDIEAGTLSGGLKKGEGVKIIGRRSDAGPSWLKVQTRSGKTGWVFASVVKERKRR